MEKKYEWIRDLPSEYEILKNKMYQMPAKPDKTIRQHTDDLIARAEKLKKYGYIDENVFRLLYLACEYHDMGKANKEFCERIKTGRRFNPKKEVVHNILSMFMMPGNEYLTGDEKEFYIIMFAVLMHHDYEKNVFGEFFNEDENIEKVKSFIEPYYGVFDEKRLKSIQRVIKKLMNCMKYEKPDMADMTIRVKGLLHKCDYAASGNYEIEYKNDFLNASMDNLLNKWRKNSKRESNKNIRGNEEINWNEMQLFCKESTDKNIIVVVQTGMGKTEASLLWLGNNKGFYILPVRTAINAMYERIKTEILEDKDYDCRLSVLHSNTLEVYLEDRNREVLRSNNIDAKKSNGTGAKESNDIDVVDYSRRGKNLSMPLTISTLDQLFDFVYKYQGYELKLATLSYSKVIIDEIQMYEPELLAYIMYGVKLISKLGGKIAIMTATLPPYIYDMFKQIGLEFEYQEFQNDLLRHHVLVKDEEINADDVCERYFENRENGKPNKILVICNCVKKAQEMYRELADRLERENEVGKVHLLHSKFMRKNRNEKEREIKACGQNYDIKNEIWVSTALVEASLDIDFDYLFTEIQDLTSLLQRMGRCNRKGLKPVSEVNVYVYTQIDKNLLRKQHDKGRGFIDKDMYDLSVEAVKDLEIGFNGVVTEEQKLALLKKYFTTDRLKGSLFMHDYETEYRELEWQGIYKVDKDRINFRNINSIDIIPHEVFIENEERFMQLEETLRDRNIPKDKREEVRKEAEIEIKKYVVSVYRWEYKKYEKAYFQCKTYKNDRHYKIRINDFEEIPVMECNYDEELGYSRIDFKDRTVESLFY